MLVGGQSVGVGDQLSEEGAVTEYTALFPFCGIGGGALGFKRAEVSMFGRSARFRIVGGIDFDSASCRDFENIVAAPALCRDIRDLSPSELLELCPEAPDVVFLSPPCKGASGLLSAKKARTRRYREMNRLALRWIELMLATWPTPPRLVLLENVPRLKQRAGGMLRRVRSLLHRAGYVFHDGFHECGELGGLAQIRRRYLLVARRPSACPSLLYQPPRKRVRGCGEVLGPMPMPGDPAGGAMHRLPRISWLNWVRLALIPAGGDWRDLEGVLRDGQPRREVFKRHAVQRWDEPSATVAGSGSNGPSAVADPRVPEGAADVLGVKGAYDHGYGVLRWGEPSPTVAGGSHPGQGAYAVADIRVKSSFRGAYANARPPTGKFSVADPRLSEADVRFTCEPRAGSYRVLSWEEAARTITGSARVDNGPFAVADPRRPPDFTPVIIAADGTWHRPLTTLELAVLQGFPVELDGKPFQLHGSSHSAWRERIGNAVPPPAAQAIAERMLVALLEADMGGFSLSGDDLPVWVEPEVALS